MKKKLMALLYCVLQALVGVLILLDPKGFTSAIFKGAGVVLAIAGAAGVIRYFRTPVEAAAKEQLLTKGLLTVLLGIFAFFGTEWILEAFPVATALYGVLMLVVGVSKVQLVADTVRKKQSRWYLSAISAGITLACAAVVILDPFSTTAVLWKFTGIAILVDAVFDLVAVFLVKDKPAPAAE